MPFYEYECSACKFYVEALQKISEPPLRKCPSCKKQTLKRLVSAPVFRLKGGGWYETDFKSDKEEKRNLAGREEAAESKADESKKDTTEAAKPAEAKSTESKPDKAKAAPTRKTASAKPAAKPVRAAKQAKSRAAAKPARKKSGRR